jgi:SAM-dependent methyltransferase
MSDAAPGGRGFVARVLRPVRELVATFALVNEERGRRVRSTEVAVSESEQRVLAEVRPELDRLREEVRRAQREHAALLQLVSGPQRVSDEDLAAARERLAATPGVSRTGVFAAVERGSRAEVLAKLEPYLSWFRGHEPIVDLGCGKGEFLELAAREGLKAYGVDNDPEVIAYCAEIGLDGREEDLLEHLRGLGDGAVGGVFCSQVVEHLPPEVMAGMVGEVARVLSPGGVALFETPNPASFATHVQSFWRDPTHIRPVPEAALSFAARTAGLIVEDVVYTSLPSEAERLPAITAEPEDPELHVAVAGLNRVIEQLNGLLYGPQDYALIASKPS